MNKTLVLFLLLAVLAACSRNGQATIFPKDCRLLPGDVVFRRGGGLSSHAVLAADKGGTYSHVGIVVDSCGVMMIVHAVPGEPDYEGDPDRVKMETPEKFYCTLNASLGEVKRPITDRATADRAARYALATYRRGTLFDHDYDDGDTVKMYCCELVENSYAKAGLPLAVGERHTMRMPGVKEINCMFPSNICKSPRLKKIISF